MSNAPLHAIEAFTLQNPELAQVERLLGQFNIFEALGAARHKLRHSDFLAFLLNPAQNHGLGATFLQSFMREVGLAADGDLSAVEVRREWGHTDILITDNTPRRVVLIENKIDTGEHSDQLARYYEAVQRAWPDYDIFALYLTPDGTEPSDDRYQAIGYDTVCRVVQEVAERCQPSLDPAVHLLMTHYAQMLGKHIVSESEISELCRRIYKEHRQALDLIYKHRPDWKSQVADIVVRMMKNYPDWNLSAHGSGYQNCRLWEWDGTYALGDILFCQFQFSQQGKLYFSLHIWQVDKDPNMCRRLWDMAQRLGWSVRRFNRVCSQVHYYSLLQVDDAELESADLEPRIHEKWNDFLETKYPKLHQQLADETWLWDKDNETTR